MNKKGQLDITMGVILITFIAVLVGVVLFQVIAQGVGSSINTVAVANQSLGDADNDTTVYMTNIRAISDVVIYNESADVIIPSTNYTVTNNVVYQGALSVSVLPTTGTYEETDGHEWTISGTAQPLTYIPDSGGRAMASLIVVFFALAVAVIALEPTLRSRVLEAFGR